MSMFRKLTEKEEKEFREGVYEDEAINGFMKYLSLCHPVSRNEVIKRITKL